MTVKCPRCGERVSVENFDEFTPPNQEKGIEITPEILDGDKAHIWKGSNGNLFIHYPEVECSKAEEPSPLVKKLYNILTDPWADSKLDAIAEIKKHYNTLQLPHGDETSVSSPDKPHTSGVESQ